ALPRLARAVEQQGDGLGEVADDGVALIEEPGLDAGAMERPVAELAAGEQPLDLAPGEEIDRPGGVLRRGDREIGRHRLDLVVGGGRAVDGLEESGEELHETWL